MEKNLITLEYDKVLERLSICASSSVIREMCLEVRPCDNLLSARVEMDKTAKAYYLSEKFGAPSFSEIYDIEETLKRAEIGSVLNLRELLDIGAVIRNIRMVHSWKKNIDVDFGILTKYFEALTPFTGLENRIFESIENEETLSDNASVELFRIRRKIIAANEGIRTKLEKMVKSSWAGKYLQDSIITTREGRFVIPVKSEYRTEVDGLVHDTSSSGQTLFIEPAAVVEANNEIKILKSQERAEIERIIKELSDMCSEKVKEIEHSYYNLKRIALYFTKAFYGAKIKACVPEISEKQELNFKKARHPLIDPKKVVAIDISLGEEFDSLIITGPNTGGKTVSIKTLGLLSLMAASGMMIPCEEGSKVCVFDAIYPDIGDEQSIEQSLSTFSSHMKNVSEILKKASDRSLVLLDELGAGTDPIEGAALAEAIVEKLRNKGALVAVTTHYAELKAYALKTNGVINASCEFDVKSLSPTYRLNIGSLGKSNAFLISLRLGIEEEVINSAKERMDTSDRRFEDVLGELEGKRSELQRMRESLENEKKEVSKIKAKLSGDLDEFNKRAEEESRKITEKAKIKAERITAEASALLDELETIRKNKNKENINEITLMARKTIRDKTASIDELTREEEKKTSAYILPRPLKVGDEIVIASINKEARVTALPDKNNRVAVEFGAIKTKVPLDDIRLSSGKKQQTTIRVERKSELVRNPDMKLDIRGRNVEEALPLLDRFIDDAVMGHAGILTIVHGKGTGVLRKAVATYLKKHKSVDSFRLGVYGEGEDGVTIVTLK